jgi:hypothetical protein
VALHWEARYPDRPLEAPPNAEHGGRPNLIGRSLFVYPVPDSFPEFTFLQTERGAARRPAWLSILVLVVLLVGEIDDRD